MGTYFAKPEDMTRKWFVVDAAGMPIGRLAVEVAKILRGKHKPTFTPHVDCGDHVIIVNAEKCVLTGQQQGRRADLPALGLSGRTEEHHARRDAGEDAREV